MNILYIGDVMGDLGIRTLEKLLPKIVKEEKVDIVIAQSENVTEGKGLSTEDFKRLKTLGVHGFTGGNWTLHLKETEELLNNLELPVTRPANYPEGTAGLPYKILQRDGKKILLVTLLGSIVGKDANREAENPLICIDRILNMLSKEVLDAIIVNFHGDFSSEKVIIGHYLDGRVSAVIGDHWHIPTADARILPKGSAHITDVGMVGSLDSSLGIEFESVVPRWRDAKHTQNVLVKDGNVQLNAVLVQTESSGKSSTIKQIRLLDRI